MSQYLANLCHTTCTGPHTMFGSSVGLPSAAAASPASATWPPCRRACTPRTSRSPTRRPCWPTRRVPQVGQHVHAAPLDLGRLRVLVLVDHVLVDRQVHEPVHLRLLPGLAERGQVLTGVAVEHELVGHDREGIVGAPLVGRKAILRRRLGHVLTGVDGVVQRGTDGLTSVQRHATSPCRDENACGRGWNGASEWLGRTMTKDSAAITPAATAAAPKIAGRVTPASWSGPAPNAARP